MRVLALLLLAASSYAHNISTTAAQKVVMIPELQLNQSLLTTRGRGHIHVGYVNAVSRPGGGRYTCDPFSNIASDAVITNIQNSLDQYHFTESLRLDYLVLCRHMTANGQQIGGIPIPPLKLLMIVVSKKASSHQVVHLFWHELFHYLEIKSGTYNDRQWDVQFSGYQHEYELKASQLTVLGGGRKGFINRYSESYPHEDRAEIAAWILTDKAFLIQFSRQNDDKLIAQKIRYVEEKLKRLGIE